MLFLVAFLALTIKVGVYDTLPQDKVLLHNRGGEVKAEILKRNRGVDLEIKNLLANAAETINSKIFSGQKVVKFELVFTQQAKLNYGSAKILPSGIVESNDGLLLSLLDQFSCNAQISLCLMVSEKHMREKSVIDGNSLTFKYTNGVTDSLTKILLFGFMHRSRQETELILLHEIGHILNLEHPTQEQCKTKSNIMCRAIEESAPPIFGDEYKKAWHDFYYQKTEQRFGSMLSK